MKLSVCTLAHGRADHLANLVRGLELQTQHPDELIIAVMQPAAYELPATSFPVRQLVMGGDAIPLAAARNAAALAAAGDRLVFLDVDCIPEPTLIADYDRLLAEHDVLLMGEVLYLPRGALEAGLDYDRFAATGVQHSDRAGPPEDEIGICTDYRCFWSLNFAMRRSTFVAVGGFDERYVGYGGEDTDFGRAVAEAGVPLRWCRGARAFHQYHPHHMPPVHHIESVIANATVFRDKWGHFTMDHWLKAFTLMGLVELVDGNYVQRRAVTEDDRAFTRIQSDRPYASTARVLAMLEGARPAIAAA